MHVAQVVVLDALGPAAAERGVGRKQAVHQTQQALGAAPADHAKLHHALKCLWLDHAILRANEVRQLLHKLDKEEEKLASGQTMQSQK